VEVGRFEQPLHVTAPAGDGRVFVVEKGGLIKVLVDGRVLPEPFVDLSGEVTGGYEQGLLSMAFAPDFATSRFVYVSYTDRGGDTRVVEYTVGGNAVEPRSRREVLRQDQPYVNHNGGLVAFDPSGKLIIGLGDGGSAGDPQNRAQNLSTLLGKLLRIDPRPSGAQPYGIPADNPFVGRAGARPEIWAYGLRNPWRFWFDSGDLYLADVGQNTEEEVNVVPAAAQAGANYGWPAFEGLSAYRRVTIDRSRLVEPVITYPIGSRTCSVTGGVVVRDGSLAGWYVYGDYCAGELLAARIVDGKVLDRRTLGLTVEQLSSFGQDAAGVTYVTSLAGPVYRLES
jgi:glucose/arabinose dehydrogenase